MWWAHPLMRSASNNSSAGGTPAKTRTHEHTASLLRSVTRGERCRAHRGLRLMVGEHMEQVGLWVFVSRPCAALCMTPSSIVARGAGGGGAVVQLRTSARGSPTRPQTNHPTHSTCTAGLTALTQACCGNSEPHQGITLQYLKKYPRAHPWRTGVHESHP